MKTIRAVYENGVFRPTESIELPENSLVEFEPRALEQVPSSSPETQSQRDAMRGVYEILSRRHQGDDPEISARHNEHQP